MYLVNLFKKQFQLEQCHFHREQHPLPRGSHSKTRQDETRQDIYYHNTVKFRK